MANVTYLLGAGASANALPVINEINGRLLFFKDTIFDYINRNLRHQNILKAQNLHRDLDLLIKNIEKHQTIDTLARKLFAQKKHHVELEKLKILISTYFIFEQLPLNNNKTLRNVIKESPDKRYDSLISSLLNIDFDNPSLAKNVKILTWNYDVQFELAFKSFFDLEKLEHTHKKLQVVPGAWLKGQKDQLIDLNEFSLIHLNGVAGYLNILENPTTTIIDKYFNAPYQDEVVLNDLIIYFDKCVKHENYGAEVPETRLFINYAWEYFLPDLTTEYNKNPFHSKVIDNAIMVASNTEILVIIGYSFPIFNREIDKLILGAMNKVKKVYIQDMYPENIKTILTNAISRFQPDNNNLDFGENKFILSNSLKQFVLPYELT